MIARGSKRAVRAKGRRRNIESRLLAVLMVIVGVVVPGSLLGASSAVAAGDPAVTAVSPDTGPTYGGTAVTVTGTGFVAGATTVDFGSTPSASVDVTSSTTLSAVSPGGASGAVDVTVTVDGQASGTSPADLFAYGPPAVSGVSPDTGAVTGGTAVVITGTGFTDTATVDFGTLAAAALTVVSGTTIDATAPAGAAGAVDVTVTTSGPGGGTSATGTADLFAYGAPTVTEVTPSGGPPSGGTVVTVTGISFVSGATVAFGGVAATEVTVHSATSLTAVAPAGSGAVDVTVTNGSGTSAVSPNDQFVYGAPSVEWISPDAGPVGGGTLVTVEGTAFATGATVDFGTTPATSVFVWSPSLLTAVDPAGSAGSVDVTVTDGAGTSPPAVGALFAYGAPTVSAVSPDTGSGTGGTVVTVTGTGFAPGASVSFGGTAATAVTVTSATTLTATAPALGQSAVDVTVTTAAGTSPLNAGDLFTTAAPSVGGVSPSVGPTAGGTSVTVTGTDFVPGATVTFGGTPASSVTVESSGLLVAVAPAGDAGTVDVEVTTSAGTSATGSADQFTYGTLEVSSVSPDGGAASTATPVTITGSGFSAGASVAFGGVAASDVAVDSSTSITAVSPPLPDGLVDVTVTEGAAVSPTSPADQFAVGPPTVSSVTPDVGSVAGGGTVSVAGTGFVAGSSVSFGSVASPQVAVVSSSTLEAAVPAGSSGAVDVTVTTPGGTSATSADDQYTYAGVPTVSALSVNGGPTSGGTTVTVSGTGFTAGSTVLFGEVPATSVTVDSSTSLTATAPAEPAGAVDVTVSTLGGTSAPNPADLFAFGAPTVSLVDPDAGATTGGNLVSATGTGFADGATVTFGGVPANQVTVLSGTELTAVAPAGSSGSVDVQVSTSGGTSSTSAADLYAYGPPRVTAVSPEAGAAGGGTTVTVYGTGFAADASVLFGSIPAASVEVLSGTELTALSPGGEGPVDVLVTTPQGTSAASPADQYIFGGPSVTSLTPDSGPATGGTVVTVDGSNFTADATVQFGGQPAEAVTVTSPTELQATAPALSGSVDVTVTTTAGTSPTSVDDLFTPGIPSVVGISPDGGPDAGGTAVTITGVGFAPDELVSFGGSLAAGWTVDSGTQITAVSPPGQTGAVDVTVTTSQGTSPDTSADLFTYGAPTVTGASPASGPVAGGTVVTITGTGFTPDAQVYFGLQQAAVTVESSTSLLATSPAAGPGVVPITVITPGGSSETAEFLYSDQLQMSCAAPPYTDAQLGCTGIDLPPVTLDGLGQTTQAPANTTYITDDRGSSAGWSVSAYLVPTTGNPNPACAGYAGFCDASVTSGNPDATIPAGDFSITNVSCSTTAGNTNPEPQAGTGGPFPAGEGAVSLCSADAGDSGGTFKLNATYSLGVPSSVYAGTYEATVEYLAF